MRIQDTRSLIGGVLLVVFGLSFALYSVFHYPVGTIARMQPGMFPALLGFLLAGIGALVSLVAMFRQVHPDDAQNPPSLSAMASVLAGIIGFGFTIGLFGLVPALFVLTLVGMTADDSLSLRGKLVLAASLSLIVVGVFSYGLGLTTPLLRWPS